MSAKKSPKIQKDHSAELTAVHKPSKEFSKKARIPSMAAYEKLYKHSIDKPEKFWASEAKELTWQKPFSKVLDWKAPDAKWFVGGKINVAENCVDRHALGSRANKAAIIWEGEPGDKRTITYAQLHREVCKFANVLLARGVKSKDRVLIYMPMIPEAAVAMLACARIGAVHNVVFGGFASEAILDRLEDSGATAIVTADGGWRRGKVVALKPTVDEALKKYGKVTNIFVVNRTGNDVSMKSGRDHWWHEEMENASAKHEPKGFDSEHPLFILYTSGSTGKPKGILHTSGGYLTGTYATCKYIFDMRDEDVYWCTADVGWITGHSYIVYGPMANGVTQVMYEGAPNQPDFGRFWKMIEEHRVTIFYTAPTAIRAFIKAGDEFPDKHDLSSLRLLGSVGEPINPEAWHWYYNKIGGGNCPIVDTWWQTETGAILISPIPGATPCIPGTATRPFFGIDVAILDDEGKECPPEVQGRLVIRKPWPSMTRTIYGDKARFKKTYFADYPGLYTAGDGAKRDKKGNFWIIGRLDDVLNVSGHRLGTAEIESALVAHPAVAESAAVGRPHDLKGQAVAVFVSLKLGYEASPELESELRNHVGKVIGAIAKPDDIHFTPALPKTRSGKIIRRLLKELVTTGTISGNVTTLEDMSVIDHLKSLLAK
ncbi:MAG: acetate--CoA ligase [Akkermansiaceae bacterium]|jgi:acetyl-CoA synthetase|nr:acetate--CoA ligase [Akkermansiaceae bacterium]MDP4647567.1 acetate--CoA ligase [Akkermansiaceae bacterium]MDP4720726.1 acetate--CoA ligase [Akkermansiaceae bacterium]MDP4779129.1 acetate--CoA ligase [Akkermansiaceae bacterium]MDP4847246.1 acetate--CoA ligase [Akkermansiaceae bacterium]